MTRDEVIRLAREAGLIHYHDSEGQWTGITNEPLIEQEKNRNDDRLVEILAPFAALVAAHVRETEFKPDWNNYQQGLADGAVAERQACAKLAQETVCDTHIPTGIKIYGSRVAKAIRARGEV